MDQDATWHGGCSWPRPHCARWGPSFPSPKGAQPPIFGPICYGQMAGWIKIPLGREVGLSPCDIELDGDPATLSQKGAEPPIFSPCLLWPNGWMDQDATWYGIRPQLRPHCVRREPSSSSSHAKVAHVYCGHGRPSQLLLSSFYLVILFYQTFYMSLILWLCLHVGNPKYNSTDSMSGSSIPIR